MHRRFSGNEIVSGKLHLDVLNLIEDKFLEYWLTHFHCRNTYRQKDTQRIDMDWFSVATFFCSFYLIPFPEVKGFLKWRKPTSNVAESFVPHKFHTLIKLFHFTPTVSYESEISDYKDDNHFSWTRTTRRRLRRGFIVATVIERNGVPTTKRHEAVPSSPRNSWTAACESQERK